MDAKHTSAALFSNDADGWIEWNGGECPVAEGVMVWIRFRDGDECPVGDDDYWLDWQHGGHDGDIIAYRVVEGGAA